ncbi:glycosyltransferase family 4 protein [Ectopseudomonas oleovorans]|uniref:Glycosyltransferase family 4 protein n=1 Tax=Ectopseudomonas oleovorans TaxID=301 RepID=A0AA42QF74_ECTOL|nr:glycosyltransferase family 4 protein [Pseudomonas oleovorans]MDH1341711.1 glycosyltransferase family 4 protein [Pseudomonas oleovorans]MDH1494115.1 glycosyltransferase family 4 protein [Pseudomonas oleovorans]WGG19459.1 glycosyltransferase family 4 protein [Pseudomonas oleovorans]
MKVAIATVNVPFIKGGAEIMTTELKKAFIDCGYDAEIISIPFVFHPLKSVIDNVDYWRKQDFNGFDIGRIDKVVSLKFPAYNLSHDNNTIWLMHQHRSIYDLYGTKFGEMRTADNDGLRNYIVETDNSAFNNARQIFTISENVSKRLEEFNGVASRPLYHPPKNADSFYNDGIFPYVYFPSRLELLKRQDLLISAMQHVAEPVIAIISGEGGEYENYKKLIKKLGLEHRIRLVGHVSHNQMQRYYANCLAVFFGPYDEDYGYVSLEAMLSEKPVITCTDSGGVTEFVVNGETGFVVKPEPVEIAEAINIAWADKAKAARLGKNAKELYLSKDINWRSVVSKLMGEKI